MTSEGLRPLREDPNIADPDLLLGAHLLQQVGAAPRSEQRKRRVWQAIGAGARAPLWLRLRAVHLAFAALLVAAASSATVSYYVSRDIEPPAPVVAPKAPAPDAPRPEAAPQAAPVAPAPAEPRAVPPVERSAPSRSKPEAGTQAKVQSEAEAQLLVEAMRARQAGDAKRVSQLVDEYRAKHPQGTLQEEALILSIESAASRRAPNTEALAREYLARFPNGRFAEQARRALSRVSRPEPAPVEAR